MAGSRYSKESRRKDWIAKVRDPEYKATVERVYVIRVEAFDWNCQQHIIPRYTAEEIREALAPAEKRMHELEQENEKLRKELSQVRGRTTVIKFNHCKEKISCRQLL